MRIWHQSMTDLDRAPLYRDTIVRHAAACVDRGVEVTVHGLRPDTYGEKLAPIDVLRHRYLETLAEAQICEAALTAQRAGYDAFALGCFYDPALQAARSLVDIPIVGLSETTMLIACSLGASFALISLNEDQSAKHWELAKAYGLEKRLATVIAMDPPIDEYTLEVEGDAAIRVTEDFQRACGAGLAEGAEVIIPGDGVLNEFVYRQTITRIRDATVMDALGVLFRYAAFMAGARSSIGLDISRVRSFAKPSQAALDHARAFAGVMPLDESDFSSGG